MKYSDTEERVVVRSVVQLSYEPDEGQDVKDKQVERNVLLPVR